MVFSSSMAALDLITSLLTSRLSGEINDWINRARVGVLTTGSEGINRFKMECIAADRPIVVAVGNDAQWLACARALDLRDLAADPALVTNAGRIADRDRIASRLQSRLRERPAAAWMKILSDAEVPAGLVHTVKEALAAMDASPIHGVAPSVPGSVRLPPPRLGEHDAEVRKHGWGAFAR